MRFQFAVAALPALTLASWNQRICGGAGGCAHISWGPDDPSRCPDGTLLNVQQTASNSLSLGRGTYDIISKAEFPSSCLDGSTPQASDTLVVHYTQFSQKMFGIIRENCLETNPEPDCYLDNPNPTPYTICQLVDTNGQACVQNPNAGECERWGYDINSRPQCKGWTPDQVETPSSS
ncbi:hypothetical protein BKA66DRAFT_606221 [Pyrenochaeta sp. MPI-SDFR-AT-0127]|nr:hypothetical protein BKA66DRAFT_606221 [Pyrenochaeta sp. MPI-SDFR-AT-0127]